MSGGAPAATGGAPVLFREEQRFTQWWVWAVVVAGAAPLWVIGIAQLIPRKESDHHAAPTWLLLAVWAVCGVGIPLLFLLLKLATEVRADGIYVRFFPFHLRFRRFPFNELRAYAARIYHPITEYGGWGLRYGTSGKAYTVRGSHGLQLEFQNGTKLLIGSQRADDLFAAVRAAAGAPAVGTVTRD